jgi:two-component system, chemotaxis family, chemotaxis protein CheY
MKILIADDDFVSRKILQSFLSRYGECDVAVNGAEAIEAVKLAWKDQKPYDLICLDIMMPKFDGQEVLIQIRSFEESMDVLNVKIVMVTALDDSKNIMNAFRGQCEGYLVKPITKEMIENQMKTLGFPL